MAGLVLLYLGLAVGDSPLPAIAAVDPAVAPLAYLAVNLVLLVVACAVNWRVFWNGIRGLWEHPRRTACWLWPVWVHWPSCWC